MKKIKLLIPLFAIILNIDLNAQTKLNCTEAKKEFDIFNDSGKVNIQKKLYITATSYFRAAQDIKEINDSCGLFNEELSNLYISIIPAATYQKLLESVISLQEVNDFQAAFDKYKSAAKYYGQFQISEFGIIHDSIKNFVFSKCKSSFALWLGAYYFKNKNYDESFSIYSTMLEKGYEPNKLKRPIYELGEQMAIRDKIKGPTDNPKGNIKRYTNDKEELKFFKLGYLFGWGQ